MEIKPENNNTESNPKPKPTINNITNNQDENNSDFYSKNQIFFNASIIGQNVRKNN
jgi:hypothetical protein